MRDPQTAVEKMNPYLTLTLIAYSLCRVFADTRRGITRCKTPFYIPESRLIDWLSAYDLTITWAQTTMATKKDYVVKL